jgi:hypothetical protein
MSLEQEHLPPPSSLGELVDELVQRLAVFGHADELAKLLAAHVVVALPGQVLLLQADKDL